MATLSLRNPNGYDGSPATQYKQGVVRLATDNEAQDGTATNVAITPAQLATAGVGADFASPPVLGFGSTTPRPVHATTLDATGDLSLLSVATKINMNGGAVTDFIGQAILASGVIAVANTNIAAADRILLSRAGVNASTALGDLSYVISAGASFTITSRKPADATTETGDLSTITYVIFRQT